MSSTVVDTVRIATFARSIATRASSDCNYPVYAVTKHAGMVPAADYFKKQVHSRDVEGYKVVARGQFAYATIHLDEGSIGVLETADHCIISPMYTVFEVDNDRVYPPYLLRVLKSPRALSQYALMGSGSVHRRRSIPFQALGGLAVKLPRLSEQKRIVAILERADSLLSKRIEAMRLSDDFLRAVFIDTFGDPVTNPKGWEVKAFAELGSLDRGVSKHRPRNDPTLLGGKHPLIQTGDVASSDGYVRSFTSTYSDKGLAQSKLWPAGTLCITIAANIAKTAILTIPACFPDSVVGFRAPEQAVAEYARFWLSFLQKTLEANAPESAQKNINLAILRDLQVPTPPIALIRNFAAVVHATEAIRSMQRQSLYDCEGLCLTLRSGLLSQTLCATDC